MSQGGGQDVRVADPNAVNSGFMPVQARDASGPGIASGLMPWVQLGFKCFVPGGVFLALGWRLVLLHSCLRALLFPTLAPSTVN